MKIERVELGEHDIGELFDRTWSFYDLVQEDGAYPSLSQGKESALAAARFASQLPPSPMPQEPHMHTRQLAQTISGLSEERLEELNTLLDQMKCQFCLCMNVDRVN
jgi:hypothetical protein